MNEIQNSDTFLGGTHLVVQGEFFPLWNTLGQRYGSIINSVGLPTI